jgi:hypothetical protein
MNQEEQIIFEQREKIKNGNPVLSLNRPCKIGDGIVVLSEQENLAHRSYFENSKKTCALFIPASGSGSRMFQFLYDYLLEPNEYTRGQVEKFLVNAPSFAFFPKLPKEMQQAVLDLTVDISSFVNFLLEKDGLNFGALPKGLIPFHHAVPFILNPFQEHLLQGKQIDDEMTFHFTIQPSFEAQIIESINQLEKLSSVASSLKFSVQDSKTDAFVFDDSLALVKNETKGLLRRPAGHGALLPNLQSLDEQLIFVKNIDNVQIYNKSLKSTNVFKVLGGLLLSIKDQLKQAFEQNDLEKLSSISKEYFLFSEEEIRSCRYSIESLVKRPIRVCGMVKNEGQPGGGPYFVDINGILTKQIVEKAQISSDASHQQLLFRGTHFNPVFMVLDFHDFNGEKFNLVDFRNDNHYFLVEKSQKGKHIRFIEEPGLWNGSMENWISIFVEIPSDVFSPVKTVLDLLDDSHR